MATNNNEGLLELVLVELISVFLIGIALKGMGRTISFTMVYMFIFFLPGLPLFWRFEGLLLRYVLVNFYGLMVIPILYFVIGRFIIPLNKPIMVILPVLVFAANLYINRDYFRLQARKKK